MADPADRGWQRPSIYDGARTAGVSHMTVSRVLNGHSNIRESTRDRVRQTIDELNYAPNSIARALAMKRAMRIGVLIDAPSQYGPNSTLRALERAARDAGYALSTFSVSDTDERDFGAGIADLVQQGVDGLCVIAPRVSSVAVLRQRTLVLPTLVVVSERDEGMLSAAVDQRVGARLATDHLIELGHRSIAHVAGPLDWYDALARESGWRQTVMRSGIEPGPLLVGDWTAECGYRIGTTLDGAQHTAVFAANDQMALGIIHGLTQSGLRVPEDVSVVGFDDLPDSRHFLPPLTTVRQDFGELGGLVLERLVGAIRGDGRADHATIEPRLIARSSTAPPPMR